MTEAHSLLAEYIQSRSEEVFEQLMKRYVDLVHSTAMRLVRGDSHLAEDVAQTVFLHLAQKADRLPQNVMLGGWLHQDTCFVASTVLRGERRRQLRERQAAELTMETNENTIFSEIAPVLDEAINQLEEEDRKAILLRFYERLDFLAVGEQLGSSENAAQKRVSRALDQLHSILIQRGIGATLSAAALGTALAAKAVEAAPAEVVASLAKAGLAGAAAGHGTALAFLKGLSASKVGLSVASVVALAGASWLAWSLWWPAKPPPLALNGTWARLSKPQPLGHVTCPRAVAIDRKGELYVAEDADGGRIQKRDLNGNWTLVASAGQSPDGLKGVVQAMAFDPSGNLYVDELSRIRKRDPQGNWTTVATPGKETGPGPHAFALDREGNLYVADGKGEQVQIHVRKPDGQWTRLDGPGNDLGEAAEPLALTVDVEGNLYLSFQEPQGRQIQKRDKSGRWSVLDEDAISVGALESPLAAVTDFWRMTSDASGALYACVSADDWLGSRLLKRDAQGRWMQLAGEGSGLGQLFIVGGISVDSTGALYVAELGNQRVQKRDPDGTWTVVAEPLKEPGVFVNPSHLALDSRGNLYVLDRNQKRVQKRDAQGRWTVVVDVPNQVTDLQDPSFPVGVDATWPLPLGLPAFSLFSEPSSVAVDREDNLYVADVGYQRVMKLNTRGQWELCVPSGAGVGQTQSPRFVFVDGSDNLYLIDTDGGRRLQKRDRKGRWSVLSIEPPNGWLLNIFVAPNGDAYACSYYRHMKSPFGIRVPDSHGRWATLAPQGPGLGQVQWPAAIAMDSVGRLFIADGGNHRIQVRDLDGRWFVLGAANPEARPQLSPAAPQNQPPPAITVDRQGVVYVTDSRGVFRWTPQPKAKAVIRASESKK